MPASGSASSVSPLFGSGEPRERPRLLLLSPHFPPGQAAGAARWQGLAHIASERGWDLDVIAFDPSQLSNVDLEALARLPPGVRVYGVRQTVPLVQRALTKLLKVRSRLRAEAGVVSHGGTRPSRNGGRPASLHRSQMEWAFNEPRTYLRAYGAWLHYAHFGSWAYDAQQLALQLFDPTAHRVVVTCGPPHMVHEAGRRIAQARRIPLVIDFRDPWSLVERLPEPEASPFWLHRARSHESKAVDAASLIVANTEPHRHALSLRYPHAAGRIITVTNGFDDGPPTSPRSQRFVIAYAGAIYLDRDPRPLFRAAASVIAKLHLTPAQLGIEFMGHASHFNGATIESLASQDGIGPYVTIHPPAKRTNAYDFLAGATMLVSLPQDSHLAIPSKVFEYMVFDAWLLALASPKSATALLLEGTDADVASPDDPQTIAAVIERRFRQHAAGGRPTRLARNTRFSRRAQGMTLFDAIDRMLHTALAT